MKTLSMSFLTAKIATGIQMNAVKNPIVSQICDIRNPSAASLCDALQDTTHTGAVKKATTRTVKKIGIDAAAISARITGGM
jgi:hypothetical protein